MIHAIMFSFARLFIIMLSVVVFSVLPNTNLNITWPSVGLGYLTHSPNIMLLYLREEMTVNYETL
jgi:hypothetical protein